MTTNSPRLIVAGLSGDCGKTIVSLSVLAALKSRGLTVSVFKKGPDYIDAAWLALVGDTVCRNLDTWMVDREAVLGNFVFHAGDADLALIEGNRGVYDGRDALGTHSTAELAKLLETPVLLVVNAAKATRTVAAVVKGCVDFDRDVRFGGVVLNRVAGERHLAILTESIERHAGLPVLGAIPRMTGDAPLIPGRHLGLVTPAEHAGKTGLARRLAAVAAEHLDLDGIVRVAESAGPLTGGRPRLSRREKERVKIGYFDDSVFTFYYPENLEALEAGGARLVPISSLDDRELPEVDALYIGGGFPETHAEALTKNASLMASVRRAALDGLPIYAECGGLIYLSRSLRREGKAHPMAGLFPVDLEMNARPVGHGYTRARVDAPNPYFPVGAEIRGHEFHYSGPASALSGVQSCLRVEPGTGLGEGRDGLVARNTMACYTHIHADGVEPWARSMIERAGEQARKRRGHNIDNDNEEGWIRSEAV